MCKAPGLGFVTGRGVGTDDGIRSVSAVDTHLSEPAGTVIFKEGYLLETARIESAED